MHRQLAKPAVESTKGRATDTVVQEICLAANVRLQLADRGSLANDPVLDELQGLSSGTALAAVLRPLGLVIVPEIIEPKLQGTRFVMSVSDVRRAKEHWPIGWPSKKKPYELVPKLWDKVDVEVAETPVGKAVAVIRW